MATTSSIKILEVCRVTPFPSSSVSSTEFSFPLTYFDIQWLKFHPTERIFFYALAQQESTCSFFNSAILPKLKHSLSLTLVHYLPLVGNIVWPADAKKPFVIYSQNDAISLIVSESNFDDFNNLCGNEMLEATKLHPYVPKLPISDSNAAIIACQITLFPNQGFSIGISTHHAILDGKSVVMFMKSWAYICNENENSKQAITLPLELTPLFDRTVINDFEGLDMVYLNKWLKSFPKSLQLVKPMEDWENLVRATFSFSRQEVEKIRRNIVSEHTHLSTFVVTCAYTLVCIVKAKTVEKKAKVGFIFAANCRSRLSPPIPSNYFGNCVIVCLRVMDAEGIMESNGVSFVANQLSEEIKGIESRVKNINTKQEIETLLEVEKAKESVDVMIGVVGSPQFEIYGTDFGWGNPKKTEVVSIDKNGSISMAESRTTNGGIDIGIVLKKHEMGMFNSIFLNALNHM